MPVPVVFLHSTGTGPAMWERGFAALAHLDAHLVALPNVGYPPGAPLERGTTCFVADQVAHLAARLPDEPFHLVAHSFGAFLALKLLMAARESSGPLGTLPARLRSVWLWEPVLFGALRALVPEGDAERVKDPLAQSSWLVSDQERGGTDEWLGLFVDYWNGQGSYAKLPDAARAPMRAMGWTMFQEVRATAHDTFPFDAYRIDFPCTLAYGAASPVASRTMIAELSRAIPHARVEPHEGLSHMAPLSRAKAVAASIAGHLMRHGVEPKVSA